MGETVEARGLWNKAAGEDLGANAVISVRIRAQIVCDRISSA